MQRKTPKRKGIATKNSRQPTRQFVSPVIRRCVHEKEVCLFLLIRYM
jgi:hypothetical protein